MLSKLFKHEMKATSRLLLPLFLVLIVLTVMDRIVLNLDIFTGALSVIPGFVTFIYIVALIAIVVVTFVIIILRFYKNLMTDEGYLMFTLPVKSHQLINSKLIASIIWTVASFVAVIASLLAVFATSERLDMIREGFDWFVNELKSEFGTFGIVLVIEMVVLIIVSILNNILQIYASVALGQLFSGHKVLGSFAAYIGLNIATQTVSTILLVIASLIFKTSFEEMNALPQIIFPVMLIIILAFNTAYYWVTNYIFKKKLNLE
jgi:hypothetical protein